MDPLVPRLIFTGSDEDEDEMVVPFTRGSVKIDAEGLMMEEVD